MGESSRRALALVVTLLASTPAAAATYGDVEVTVESEPKGRATHGYAEVWVRVANTSASSPHAVRLTYPRSSYSTGGDFLRVVTRTVTVEPGKVARVALAFPERLAVGGDGVGVAIDGTEQEGAVPLGSGGRGYGGSGRRGYGTQGLVLHSPAVDARFPEWIRHVQMFARGSVPPEFDRADRPAEAWSPNWLGYTRYDGIVVTADDVRKMPAEVKAAVAQYVECGGSLLVLGGDRADLPTPWKPESGGTPDLTRFYAGFGECLLTRHTEFLAALNPAHARLPNPVPSLAPLHAALDSWAKTAAPWQRTTSPGEANRRFPVVDDLGVPTTGLLSLMFLFAVVIGPLNLYVLARWKRKLWLFWTVPAFSLFTCLLVFGYMAVAEGWKGRARVEGITILDENTRRASTLGWTGVYTPLLPGGGLHFGPETEVTFQNGDDHRGSAGRRSGAALTIDWTHEQNLASGWLAPRVPAHFAVRKGEARRERVTFTRTADGRVEAVNGLGADLTDLWYADENGNLFHAPGVPAGGRAALSPATRPTPLIAGRTLRDLYTTDWADLAEWAARDGPALLAPRTYLGVMDAAPFLDEPLAGASRKARSAVLGIIKDGPDGG